MLKTLLEFGELENSHLIKKIAMYLNLPSDHEIVGYLYVGTPAGASKKIPELDVSKFVTRWDK